ncbi:MAG: 30S ribosomal protein S20 [Thermovirga sp.]|nr:30S ribosomal protein S20 [Thermovirga sp.]
MPNKKSAAKKLRVAERNRLYNKYWNTRCKTTAKKVLEAVASGNKELAIKRLDEAQSVLDKAAVKGVIHKNKAARKKSRLTKAVKSLFPHTTNA